MYSRAGAGRGARGGGGAAVEGRGARAAAPPPPAPTQRSDASHTDSHPAHFIETRADYRLASREDADYAPDCTEPLSRFRITNITTSFCEFESPFLGTSLESNKRDSFLCTSIKCDRDLRANYATAPGGRAAWPGQGSQHPLLLTSTEFH